MPSSPLPYGGSRRDAFVAMLAIGVMQAAVVLLSLACAPSPQQVADGDDPLAALAVSTPSVRYTAGFWREQARAAEARPDAPGLWPRAVAYCGDDVRPRQGLEGDGGKPNCGAVRLAAYQAREDSAAQAGRAQLDATLARWRLQTASPAASRAGGDSAARSSQF